MPTVVIVGASHAAVDVIANLRRFGWDQNIILVGEEPSLPYQRPPLSKGYYKGEINSDKLLLRPDSFYQKNKVELCLGVRAKRIDRDQKSVTLSNGETISYSYLILATGTRARQLAIPGADLKNIYYLRTREDVDSIKAGSPQGANLLIVGAGYIGLEIAASAVKQDISVTVLEAQDRVLARVTSPIVSEFYQSLHASEGVDIKLNALLTEFQTHDEQTHALLQDDETLAFDAAIVGIGVIPNTELADQAGLACDNGIVVNEHTQTDDPCIFAIGDCSNHQNLFYGRRIRLESVPNATEQAKVAAATICDKEMVYDALPWFWSDQYDVKLQTAGLFQGYDEIVTRGDPQSRKFAAFYLLGGRLIAVDAINSPAEFMVSKKLIMAKTPINKSLLHRISIVIR